MTDVSPAEAVFFAALAKVDPAERAAYLNEACGADVELRRRVDRLLEAHPQVGSFLQEGAADVAAPVAGEGPGLRGGATVDLPLVPPRAGATIGPYKLLQQIGEGGMGTVYLAEQTQPVQRKVALKVIKPGMDSRQVIARFEAERQALAIMDHVNIARVFDGGTTESGRPYFVMELVHGVPITKYCDDNHLTPRERLELFVPVCQAIQHAHQKGIIHRDLKPSNVLVTLYDGKPVPKVIDFGVAKATEQKLTERTLFTQDGTMIGTFEYMSPEQAEMSALGVDTRSDIYSLGVLLYELLTGSTPLTHKRMKEAAYVEILRMIKEEEPPKPSTRLSDSGAALASIAAQRKTEPAKLTKLVRGELDWIVMKTLEKDRNRRYETANGFAADVQRYLSDEPVQACPPSAWYRFRKFARRNKGGLAVATGVFLAVTVMAASIGWAVGDRAARLATVAGQVRTSLNAARAKPLAEARQKLAEARAQLGKDRTALAALAADLDAADAELDRLQAFLDLIDRAHEAETAPGREQALVGDGSHSGAGPRPIESRWARQPAAAVPFLLGALARYEVLERDDWNRNLEGGFLGAEQVEHLRRLAYAELLWLADDLLRRQQEHGSGRQLSPEAAAVAAFLYLGKAADAHRPTQALYVLRGRCRKALGDEAAAQADKQLSDQTPPTRAVDHYLRGLAAYDAKQLGEGVRAFEAALRVEPTHYWSLMRLGYCLCDLGQGPEDYAGAARVFTGCILKRPEHAHAYYCRAVAYNLLHRYEEAVADSTRAIQLEPTHAAAWCSRGEAYGNLGHMDKALADFNRAIELDPKFTWAWYNRGIAFSNLGHMDKAVADYNRAIELDPKFAAAWTNRGTAYDELGQYTKAVADYSRAIELDPKFAPAWFNRGIVFSNLGQPDKALIDYQTAVKLAPASASCHNALARLLATCPDTKLRDPDQAVKLAKKAVELAPKEGGIWNTLGVAHYRAGEWELAGAALHKSMELQKGGDASDWLFLAMAHHQRGNHDEARKRYDQAVEWLTKNKAALEKDKSQAEELRRFRSEAEEVLERKK
jgi:tetratricopeptide (TPR) repeat protein/serine/threonine protein kinase